MCSSPHGAVRARDPQGAAVQLAAALSVDRPVRLCLLPQAPVGSAPRRGARPDVSRWITSRPASSRSVHSTFCSSSSTSCGPCWTRCRSPMASVPSAPGAGTPMPDELSADIAAGRRDRAAAPVPLSVGAGAAVARAALSRRHGQVAGQRRRDHEARRRQERGRRHRRRTSSRPSPAWICART